MTPVSMTVLRDGYWDGSYARRGDTITVDEYWVVTLEHAGFAVPVIVEPARVASKSRNKPLSERN